jgi:hypothetical protein
VNGLVVAFISAIGNDRSSLNVYATPDDRVTDESHMRNGRIREDNACFDLTAGTYGSRELLSDTFLHREET